MFHALSVTPALTNTVNLPLLLTLAAAVIVLVAIAVYLRRLRTAGHLSVATTSISAASAALVLATALLASVSLGAVSTSHASVVQTTPVHAPIAIDDLQGLQLPTE